MGSATSAIFIGGPLYGSSSYITSDRRGNSRRENGHPILVRPIIPTGAIYANIPLYLNYDNGAGVANVLSINVNGV
jgi:hypothetical protein